MAFSLQSITATENVIAGLSDRPQLSSSVLKDKFDQMGEEIKSEVNTKIVSAINSAVSTSVTDTHDKIPTSKAVKNYVDEAVIEAGAGDMTKNVYDTNNSGVVDSAEGLTTAAKASLMLEIYPIGSIYMSTTSTNPSSYFGGTWTAWGTGKVPVGVDTNDNDFSSPENTGGEKSHLLSSTEMASHNHGVNINSAGQSVNHIHVFSSFTSTNGVHSHKQWNNQTAHVATSAGATWLFATGPDNEHGSTADRGPSICITEFTGDHYHTFSGTTAGPNVDHAHNVSGNTASSGGGTAHNNLQPYITCYMWKRTQ